MPLLVTPRDPQAPASSPIPPSQPHMTQPAHPPTQPATPSTHLLLVILLCEASEVHGGRGLLHAGAAAKAVGAGGIVQPALALDAALQWCEAMGWGGVGLCR
jgi:hypothetical protein